MIAATHALAIPGFAQTGSEALLGASDGIYSYVPFIQGLCYVIAALIAIVGAASVYMAMQTSPQQVSKRIVTSVGSCLCFVCMAISLPQFFGYESYSVGNGSDIAMNGVGGSSNGFLTTDRGGISQSGINTTIPPLSDKAGNWITFPPGSNMASPTVLWTSTTTWVLVSLALMGVHLTISTMSSVMEISLRAHTTR